MRDTRRLASRRGDAYMRGDGAVRPQDSRDRAVTGETAGGGQLLCALALFGLLIRQAQGEDAAEIIRHILFGNLLVTALIGVAMLGLVHFHRLWRQREAYIFHDGARLYRGRSDSWPLSLIRDVVIRRNEIGIESLRLVVDDDSEVTRELVKLSLLEDPPEAVRGGVMFAVAGVRGFLSGSVLN